MPSRSRRLLTRAAVSVDGGTPVEAGRKEVEAALRSLPDQLGIAAKLQRSSGEMTFTYSHGKYEVACDWACETLYLPYLVTLKEALSIAWVFAQLDMLHEGHTWRERE